MGLRPLHLPLALAIPRVAARASVPVVWARLNFGESTSRVCQVAGRAERPVEQVPEPRQRRHELGGLRGFA